MKTFDAHILKWIENLVAFEKFIKETADDDIANILDTLVIPSSLNEEDEHGSIHDSLKSIKDFHLFRDILSKDTPLFFHTFLSVVEWHSGVPNRGYLIWHHIVRGRGYSLISVKTNKRVTFNKEYMNNIQLFHNIISHNERING